MIEVPIIDKDGKVVGKEELDEQLFGGYVRRVLLKEIVLMYEANKRAGLASVKTRGKIRGSNKKKWRQKGTGRARVGSGKVSHFRGGGVVHGPQPRDFSYSMSKKSRRLALQSALLAKFKKTSVKILDHLEVKAPKTKEVASLLKQASLTRSCLLVNDGYDKNLLLSVRNIPSVNLLPVTELNAYAILGHSNVLFTKEAFASLKKIHSSDKQESSK